MSSKTKRRINKYEKQQRNIEAQQEFERQTAIAYYKKNPVIFVERELGVELYAWQKALLKLIFDWGFKNGSK